MMLESVPMSALAEVRSGGGAPQDPHAFTSTGHPFVRAGSLPKLLEGASEESLERLEPATAEKYGLSLFPAGTVLFAKSGMSATKGHVYRLRRPAYVVNHLAALVPHNIEDSAFLVRVLQRFPPTVLIRDPAYPSIRLGDIESMKVLAPRDLGARQWIAGIIDKADSLRAKRRAAIAQLDTLTQFIFHDMFGDPFAQREKTVRLGDVADILMGQSPPGSSYNMNSVGTPLLNGPTEFGDRYPIETQWTTESTRLCEAGDILFCVRGATAGRLNRADKTYCLGRGLAAIRPRTGMAVNADFLFAVLDRYYGYFQAKGVGSTFINISRDELKALPIPHVQQDTADTFAHRVAAVETLKATHRVSLAGLDALFASLQHRAFRGEM